MKIRINYEKLAGHYHCAVYTQLPKQVASGTFAKVGDLVLDEEDFHHLQNHFNEIEVMPKGKSEPEFLVATNRRR
jgi:thymidylate synthase